MSIQELLMNMPSATNSNVLLTPKEMPVILSQRFQKNGSNYRFLQMLQTDIPDTNQGSLYLKKKRVSVPKSESKSCIDQPKEDKVESNRQNTVEQAELEYSPFKLKPNSSFNSSKLSQKQIRRLDPLTLAKYEAYSIPNPDILSKVLKSECRAKAFIAQERKQAKTKVEEAKKKWNILHCGYQDDVAKQVGEKNALQARERMKSKLHQIVSHRSTELKCLVEGQSSALEAIRLKEFLVPPRRLKLDKLFTEKDRLRLDELIAYR